MGIYLNPGNDGFKRALNSAIYVDKSGLIAYTNRVMDSEQEYICASRPRRFGKLMAANMLLAYYSRGCSSDGLFSSLEIAGESSYKEHLNQYDVIFLNMQHFLSGVKSAGNITKYLEKTVLAELKEVYGHWIPDKEKQLPAALSAVFSKDKREKKGFIFIIDEWDCIFREDKQNKKAQKVYLDFLKDLLKDRIYVKLAYMTGILPIKKYGTHSALNIFSEFSMTGPKNLAEFAGFTEMEVKELCFEYNMDFEEARRWYDGYQFKEIKHIYNPKSIVDAMTEEEFQSYWTGTETYEALKIYIDLNFDGLKDAIISMIRGARCKINVRKFQNDMTSFTSKDEVLALLIHLGYLAYDGRTKEVFIPNMEIMEEFKNAAEGTKEKLYINT